MYSGLNIPLNLQPLELTDRITIPMDHGNTPISIFSDLSKAFDTLDHRTLLEKHKCYSITGTAQKLMESYITNRNQYVEIDNTNYDTLPIMTSVPQGSILGPLLFIIYINDIVSSSKLFDFIIYANDTTLSTTLDIIIKDTNNSDPESIINKELQNINDWLKRNKLSVNIAKCKYMIFLTQQKVKPLD